LQGALASLGRLQRSPLPTLMTVAVIGIALALPGALYVVTHNLERLSGNWEQTAAISLFLRVGVGRQQAADLARRLGERSDVDEALVIAPDQALEDLRAESAFAEAVEQLEENPLPFVITLRPAETNVDAAALEQLQAELTALSETDFARLDTQWLRRFQGIVRLAEHGALLLAALLSLGVLLIIGNTIRLEIENRRNEIEIMELVGATHGFIRRPFLYTGAWYGFLGGLTAWILISLALSLLQGPVSRLAQLYQASFSISGLNSGALAVLIGGSVLLGLLGSSVSVSRHLRAVDPV
jgi:cell division transport system permease protein